MKVVCPLIKYQEFMIQVKKFVDDRNKKLFKYFNPSTKELHLLGFRGKEIKDEKSRRKNLKIHISIDEIDIKKFKYREGDYLSHRGVYRNPNGLWYACGDEYHKHFYKVFDKHSFFTDFKWLPINVYLIDYSKLKVAKLDDCEKLIQFSMKYKSKNVKSQYLLDIDKVMKDYDGIELCPYITFECLDLGKYKEYIRYDKDGILRILIDNE